MAAATALDLAFVPPSAVGLTDAQLVDERAPRMWFQSSKATIAIQRMTSAFCPWEYIDPPIAAPAEGDPAPILLRSPGYWMDAAAIALAGPRMTQALLGIGGFAWGVLDTHFDEMWAAAVDVGGLRTDISHLTVESYFEALSAAGAQASTDPRMALDDTPAHVWHAEIHVGVANTPRATPWELHISIQQTDLKRFGL